MEHKCGIACAIVDVFFYQIFKVRGRDSVNDIIVVSLPLSVVALSIASGCGRC